MKTKIERFGDDKFKLTNSMGETAYVPMKKVPHPGEVVRFNGPNGPVNRQLGEIELIAEKSQVADYFTAPMYEGEFVVLAQLLVRYHNSITKDNASLYGEKMDKALCRDTFGTLYHGGPYTKLQELEAKFNVPR